MTPNGYYIAQARGWCTRNCSVKPSLSRSPSPLPLSKARGHPSKCHIYDTMRQDLYWPCTAHESHMIAGDFHSYSKNHVCFKRKLHSELLSANRPLKFIAIDILGLVPKRRTKTQVFIVITNRYPELPQDIPSCQSTKRPVAPVFLDRWIVSYRFRDIILIDNGPQFASKFFKSFRAILAGKQLKPPRIIPRLMHQRSTAIRPLGDASGVTLQNTNTTVTYSYRHCCRNIPPSHMAQQERFTCARTSPLHHQHLLYT